MFQNQLCVACRSRFHGNCRPFTCVRCNSLTHRKCTTSRRTPDADFLCIRCSGSESVRPIPMTFLPPGRSTIPTEVAEVHQELRGRQQKTPSHRLNATESTPAAPTVKRERSPSARSAQSSNFSSSEESSESSDDSGEDSTPNSTTIEVPDAVAPDVSTVSILKMVIKGIRGNFMITALVLVILFIAFLALIAFVCVINGTDKTSVFPAFPRNATMLPDRITAEITEQIAATTDGPTGNPATLTSSPGPQIVSISSYNCAPHNDVNLCVDRVFGNCLVTPSVTPPRGVVRIAPIEEESVLNSLPSHCPKGKSFIGI